MTKWDSFCILQEKLINEEILQPIKCHDIFAVKNMFLGIFGVLKKKTNSIYRNVNKQLTFKFQGAAL